MNVSGIVTFARWSSPLPGRTTSRRNQAEMPALAPAAPSAGFARFRKAGSRARRGASATKPSVPAAPPPRRQCRARRSPRIAPGLAGRREVRAPIPPEQAGHDGGEARDADQRGSHADSGAEPPVQRRGERHGAAAERDEPRRHHVWIVRILRGEPADVLVPELVFVLTALCDKPGRGERGRPEDPAGCSEAQGPAHRPIVRVRRFTDATTRGPARTTDREARHEGVVSRRRRDRARTDPRTGPVLLVASHHGGFVDPALLVAVIPRPISFLAVGTLFRNPVIRGFLSFAGALPIHRAQDSAGAARSAGNVHTFAACFDDLREGGVIGSSPRARRATSRTSCRSARAPPGSPSEPTLAERWGSGSSPWV